MARQLAPAPAALQAIAAFQALPAEVLDWLAHPGQRCRCADGEIISPCGTPAARLGAVGAGTLQFYAPRDGRPQPVFKMEAGSVGGGLPYPRLQTFKGQRQAVGDTTLFLLPRTQFAALSAKSLTSSCLRLPRCARLAVKMRSKLWCCRREGQAPEKRPARALSIFIGAKPSTEWVRDQARCDAKGCLLTGRDLVADPRYHAAWQQRRESYLLATCVPGMFAAGDGHAGAMARVASAVGKGCMAIKVVRQYLGEGI